MRRFLIFGIVCILISGCGNPDDQESMKAETAESEISIIKQVSAYHTFSNPATKDIFLVRLIGDSVQTAMVTFEIRNKKGEQLYSDTFEANYLLNYDLPENATSAQRDEFILNRIGDFFDEENFKTPAIAADMTFDPNYSNEKVWKEIEADSGAIGFYYLLGKEDGRWLAYSKPQQKVVLYFNCC